jgi:hypothetical protein
MTRPVPGGLMRSPPIPEDALDEVIYEIISGTEISYGEVIGDLREKKVREAREEAMSALQDRGFTQVSIAEAFRVDPDHVSRAIIRLQRRRRRAEIMAVG